MQTTYLYLSLIPESLIFSHLPPDKFGMYLAIGSKRNTEQSAVFFRVDESKAAAHFDLERARARCTVHPDGTLRHSTYVSVYGVLAQMPVEALGEVYLTTHTGFTLGLKSGECPQPTEEKLYFYQELCPVVPKVVSRLAPEAFCRHVTDPAQSVFLPRLVFADLQLDDLASDPARGNAGKLPYRDIDQLRECLVGLSDNPAKQTKIVYRDLALELSYSLIEKGLYVGDQTAFRYYPLPPARELERDHYLWWHSSRSVRQY